MHCLLRDLSLAHWACVLAPRKGLTRAVKDLHPAQQQFGPSSHQGSQGGCKPLGKTASQCSINDEPAWTPKRCMQLDKKNCITCSKPPLPEPKFTKANSFSVALPSNCSWPEANKSINESKDWQNCQLASSLFEFGFNTVPRTNWIASYNPRHMAQVRGIATLPVLNLGRVDPRDLIHV